MARTRLIRLSATIAVRMTSDVDLVRAFCAYCGDVLGVYEPVILVGSDRRATRTSRLNHPVPPPNGVMVHEGCYERRQNSSEEPPG